MFDFSFIGIYQWIFIKKKFHLVFYYAKNLSKIEKKVKILLKKYRFGMNSCKV